MRDTKICLNCSGNLFYSEMRLELSAIITGNNPCAYEEEMNSTIKEKQTGRAIRMRPLNFYGEAILTEVLAGDIDGERSLRKITCADHTLLMTNMKDRAG